MIKTKCFKLPKNFNILKLRERKFTWISKHVLQGNKLKIFQIFDENSQHAHDSDMIEFHSKSQREEHEEVFVTTQTCVLIKRNGRPN